VFCEGKNTEPDYILDFARDHGVKVDIGEVTGCPMTLVDAAAALRKKSKKNGSGSFGKNDPIWVVFDCDQHPNIDRAREKARANDIGVSFSNPCFEVWGVLHFQDHDQPMHRHALQKLLASLMPTYARSKRFDYSLMRPTYSDADVRARRLERWRIEQRDPEGNPFTGIYLLLAMLKKGGRN
jgi:hypothetical protein